MGGPQRLVERAGPARARELVYTGATYDAETLAGWNVVNRVLPDDGFDDAARAFAMDLATGPTVAHAATKRIVRAALEGGVEAADAVVPDVAGRAVRHGGPQGGRRVVPRERPGQGHVPRSIGTCAPTPRVGGFTHGYRDGQVVLRRQGVRVHHS